MRKRVAALFLIFCMVLTMLPAQAAEKFSGEILPTEDTLPEEASPAEDEAPAEDVRPIEEVFPAEDAAPAEETPPAEDVSPEEVALAEETATSGACGENVTWSLADGTLTISGTGPMTDYYSGNAPWYSNRDSVETVIIDPGVTSIGNCTFIMCSNLTSVEISDSVTAIGKEALSYCTSLTDITIPESVTTISDLAFYHCNSLPHITIPDSVTSIGDNAFAHCYSLPGVTIPDGVPVIGSDAFTHCTSLTRVTIPDSVTSIGVGAFGNCLSLTEMALPDSVTSIGDWAFYNCRSLTEVTIPEGITTIASNLFSQCDSLTSVTLPNSVTFIGNSAFSGCSVLTDITIPDGVTSIGNNAFSGCGVLMDITIPDGVTAISDGVFSDCIGLTDIILPDGVTSIGSSAFARCTGLTAITIPDGVTFIGDLAFSGCSVLTDITVPDGVTSIGKYAFSYCGALTCMTIPDSVVSIGFGAFQKCTSLMEVTLPKNLPAIDSYTFDSCSSLEIVIIPESVITIGGRAFAYSGLTRVIIPDNVTSIGENAFYYCKSLTGLSIPDGILSIGSGAFRSCQKLTDIYFGGSETRWKTLIAQNDPKVPGNTAIHYALFGGNGEPIQYVASGGCIYFDEETGTIIDCDEGVSITTLPRSINGVAVKAIGDEAFKACGNLTELKIPVTVKTIGDRAFQDCSNLESVRFLAADTVIGKNAFANCTSLTAMTLPTALRSIPEEMFSGCGILESVTVPDSVAAIETGAFLNCSKLSVIYYGGTEAQWEAIRKDGPIPGSVKICYNCSGNLCACPVTGGNIYFDLDTGRIVDCDDNVTSAPVPASIDGVPVEAIGDMAFQDCTQLTEITIPVSVSSIGACAFSNCTALTRIHLPNSVAEIAEYAFYKCGSLAAVTIPDSVLSIEGHAFSDCRSLTEIALPDSIAEIAEYTFAGCHALTVASIPDSVSSIGQYAFLDCRALEFFAIPSGMTEIKEGTFFGCGKLWHIKIPASVIRILSGAFARCDSLSNVYYSGNRAQWYDTVEIGDGNHVLKSPSLLINTWKHFRFRNSEEFFFYKSEAIFDSKNHVFYYKRRAGNVYEKILENHMGFQPFWRSGTLEKACEKWGGACYGMAAVEGMVNTLDYPVTAIDSNAVEISNVDYPRDNIQETRNLLHYYFLSQLIPNNKFTEYAMGTKEGETALENLVKCVLNDKRSCMFGYGFTPVDSKTEFAHSFILEGGRKVSDENGEEFYELIGLDNRYYDLYYGIKANGAVINTGEPVTVRVHIPLDYSSCVIYPLESIICDTSGHSWPVSHNEKANWIRYTDTFDRFTAIDPTGKYSNPQLLEGNEPDLSSYLYYFPENTSVKALSLRDADGSVLLENETPGSGVNGFWHIITGLTVTEGDGNASLESIGSPPGLAVELDRASIGSVCTASGISGTCAYISSGGMASVSVENPDASAKIDLTNHAVTLENAAGEFCIVAANSESGGVIAAVSGVAGQAADTITVTADSSGGITLKAPAGAYQVTFEGGDDEEITVPITVPETGSGEEVRVENPLDAPIPCDTDAYAAEIEWKDGGAYTVTLTGADSNLTGWQACYDSEGKLLSMAELARDGMCFSGKVSQEGTCCLFIVDGNRAPVIRKYNLTKYSNKGN